MIVALLVAGIGSLLVGLLAIVFGIPVKEFSFGNTLIVVGTVAACTGLVMLGFWMVVRALNDIARRLGSEVPARSRAGAAPSEDDDFLVSRDQPAAEDAERSAPSFPPPWQGEGASRDRGRMDVPPTSEPVEAAPAVKPRRNLLFSSSSRKERERAQARAADPSAVELQPAPGSAPSASEPTEAPPATFEDAWPKSERARTPDPPPRRGGRPTPAFTETTAAATAADRYSQAARNEDHQPPVTVLKSGVVDGMAYSLYSDGSIEAQMPEGMMRFASIDELRAHLDHRP